MDDLKAQKKALEDKVQPIITKLYANAGGPDGGAAAGDDEEADHSKDEL